MSEVTPKSLCVSKQATPTPLTQLKNYLTTVLGHDLSATISIFAKVTDEVIINLLQSGANVLGHTCDTLIIKA